MAEVGRGEKVGEMPALIKIKGLNIREDQKWKSFFKAIAMLRIYI